MSIENKYQKATIEYWLTMISRKFYTALSAYPEFVFIIKIIVGVIFAFLVFSILRKFVGN